MIKKFLNGLKLQHLALRGSSLYLMQAPLWLATPISLFRGQLFKTAALLGVIGCISYGAALTRRYYLQQRDALLLDKDPALIRDERHIAMGFISLGVFILTILVARRFMLAGLIAAALAALGYYLNYLAGQSTSDDTEFELDEEPDVSEGAHLSPALRAMVNDAYHYLAQIKLAATQLSQTGEDDYITTRLQQIFRRTTSLLQELSKDGARIRDARSFLVVHLRELAEISQTYSHAKIIDKSQSRQQFSTLLDTIHAQLNAQHEALSEAEQQRLSIQMDVLQDQLESKNKDE